VEWVAHAMYYLDTSVLVSYIFVTERRHALARQFLENLAHKGLKLYISPYTLVELYNSVCRNIAGGNLKLADPFNEILNRAGGSLNAKLELLVSMIVTMLVEMLGLEVVDDHEIYKPAKTLGFELPLLYCKCIELSHRVKIRIKDLLHIVYAHLLHEKYNIRYIVTCDSKDYGKTKEQLRHLGLEVIIIEEPTSSQTQYNL